MSDIRTHRYRCTKVVTDDYGDGQAAGATALAHLHAIVDGSNWQSRPSLLVISVPLGTRPGSVWTLTLQDSEAAAINVDLWHQSEATCSAQYDKLLARYDAVREPLRRALLAADNLLATLEAHQENVGEHLEFEDQAVVDGAKADMAFAQTALDGWL